MSHFLTRLLETLLYDKLGMSSPALVEMLLDITSQPVGRKHDSELPDDLIQEARKIVKKFQEDKEIESKSAKQKNSNLNESKSDLNQKQYVSPQKTKQEPDLLGSAEKRQNRLKEWDRENLEMGFGNNNVVKKSESGAVTNDNVNDIESDSKRRKVENESDQNAPQQPQSDQTSSSEALTLLREQQREIYLREREERQLELKRKELEAKKQLLQYEKLTARELRELENEEKRLEIAERQVKKRKEDGGFFDSMRSTSDGSQNQMFEFGGNYNQQSMTGSSSGQAAPPISDQNLFESAKLKQALGQTSQADWTDDQKKQYSLVMENAVIFEELDGITPTPIIGDGKSSIKSQQNAIPNLSLQLSRQNQLAEKKKLEQQIKRQQLLQQRQGLPVWAYKQSLMEAIKEYPILILQAETGSGKTTQITQFLIEEGYGDFGRIGCTQPRRVAAMSVAARVAEEFGCSTIGKEVGYSIRFDDRTDLDGPGSTKIKYMTDGMLLREFLKEPDLKSYSALIIDEAHERTLNTDILFGLAKDVVLKRQQDFEDYMKKFEEKENNNDDSNATDFDYDNAPTPFKLIISSATLDAEKFSNYFCECPIFRVPGRRYPVAISYTKAPEAAYVAAAAHTVLQIHLTQPLKGMGGSEKGGDILVFLTGVQDIEECAEILRKKMERLMKSQENSSGNNSGPFAELLVLQIYAQLPPDQQAKIFLPTPPNCRKVVLSTNIAETSITIDNISYVIDSGYQKQNSFQPRTGLNRLEITPISKAASNQRAGRAGRVGPGKTFRLYTKFEFEKNLDDNNLPEVLRSDVRSVVLLLLSLGVKDVLRFDFMDPPPTETLQKTLELLYGLMALNSKGELTKLGRRLAELPLEPMLGKALLTGEKYRVMEEMLTICGVLAAGEQIFVQGSQGGGSNASNIVAANTSRKNFQQPGGDILTYLHVYDQWEQTNYSQYWCQDHFLSYRGLNRSRDIRQQLENTVYERLGIEKSSRGEIVQKSVLEELIQNTQVNKAAANRMINHEELIQKTFLSGFFFHVARINPKAAGRSGNVLGGKGSNSSNSSGGGSQGAYVTIKHPHTVDVHPTSALFEVKPKLICYFELWQSSEGRELMRECSEVKSAMWLKEVASHFFMDGEMGNVAQEGMPRK